MSTFDMIPDAPGLLRAEAINIALKFERTGETTGRISWNIPSPAMGCAADQQAYCGMLVTLDTKPSSIDKIPVSGTVYSSDSSVDENLFAGDKLKTSHIIGAFYNDRTTTMFDVTGLKPNTPYYITGFPMDCQYRFFVEGVHSYSTAYINRGTDDTHGSQVVVLNSDQIPMGVTGADATGLSAQLSYNFTIQIGVDPKLERPLDTVDCKFEARKYLIEIDGTDSQTYDELVIDINKELAKLRTAPQSPQPPNAGAYYWNAAQTKLFSWDGYKHSELTVIVDDQIPNTIIDGFFWMNPTDNILRQWQASVWKVVSVMHTPFDPAQPRSDSSYWFDGTKTHLWNGVTWCLVYTYNQATDPSLAAAPPEGTFWFNEATHRLLKWNSALEMWFDAEAIQSATDPIQPQINAFWFNEQTNVLYARDTPNPGWNPLSNVSKTEHAPLTPAPFKLWYNPSTGQLFQRDVTNTSWREQDVISHPEDPTRVDSCGLWWNTELDQMYVWDKQKGVWVYAPNFVIQLADPSASAQISDGAVWYNPTTRKLMVWENNCFVEVPFTNWPTDPRGESITDGVVWHNTTTNVWKVRVNHAWYEINLVVSATDPSNLKSGSFWYNPATRGLAVWNGIAWVSVLYAPNPLTPVRDMLWFDTSIGKLMQWNGMAWVFATPLATVELDCNGNLMFVDTTVGSSSMIRLYDGNLFSNLSLVHSIHTSTPGTDGASAIPSYSEIGIGDSGDGAARKEVANQVRMELGYPINTVELTAEMIDYGLTKAIEELRQKSSIGYKRGFFFMYVKPNEQRYFLTNKISGMNKIVDVLSVQRMRGSALTGGGHDAGINGQIIAQHLYSMGTFDLLSYHLMAEYGKLMETLFATRIAYTWNEQTRQLWMHQNFPYGEQMVMIEAAVERSEQDLLTDRYSKVWLRKYAAAQARLMLAEVRGKFSTLPGAGGSVSLNADALRASAEAEMERLLLEITDYVIDRPEEWGSGTTFLFG